MWLVGWSPWALVPKYDSGNCMWIHSGLCKWQQDKPYTMLKWKKLQKSWHILGSMLYLIFYSIHVFAISLRMTAYFDKTGWPVKAPKTEEERKEFIASLHKRKTELFMVLIEKKLLPLRPGVERSENIELLLQ